MAEEKKSFYRRSVEYLQKPPQRIIDGEKRSPLDRYDSMLTSNYGFNTQSGFFPQILIDDMGDALGNSAVTACLNVLATSFAEPSLKVYKKIDGGKELQQSHPMEILMNRPNEFLS